MPLPTLLQPGKIKIQSYYTQNDIQYINQNPAKDFILKFFHERVPNNGVSRKPIKSINDRILIVKSGTGSGKSTTFAPELYINFFEQTRSNIAITQPTTLTTVGIPERVASIYKDRGIELGVNIGWQTGSSVFKPRKGIIFLTTGTLVQQMIVMSVDAFCKKYGFIIIDECHSRSLDMDICLYLLKSFLHENWSRPDCPFIILTSATFNTKKYAKYFEVDDSTIHDIEGSSNFPIETHFLKAPVDNYLDTVYNIVMKIHTENTKDYSTGLHDVLVFLYGSNPIKKLKERFDKINPELKDNHFIVIKMTSESFKTSSIDYYNFIKDLSTISIPDIPNVRPKRRIILTTNVAETGITPEEGKYVIDTIYSNKSYYIPGLSVSALVPSPVVRANMIQRRGRVGRIGPGVWYPLTSEKTFKKMKDNDFPDIIMSDFTESLLRLIVYHYLPDFDGNVLNVNIPDKTEQFTRETIQLIDPPPEDGFMNSIEKLFVLGFIDSLTRPTVSGLLSSHIRKIPLESTRMILHSFINKANMFYLVSLSSMLNTRCVLPRLFKPPRELEDIKKYIELDDFLIQFLTLELAILNNFSDKWFKKNMLSKKTFLHVLKTRDEILMDIFKSGLDFSSHFDKTTSLVKLFSSDHLMALEQVKLMKECIYEGYKLNSIYKDDKYKFYSCSNKRRVLVQTKTNASRLVCYNFSLSKNQNGPYFITADQICIMDKFVNVDCEFVSSN